MSETYQSKTTNFIDQSKLTLDGILSNILQTILFATEPWLYDYILLLLLLPLLYSSSSFSSSHRWNKYWFAIGLKRLFQIFYGQTDRHTNLLIEAPYRSLRSLFLNWRFTSYSKDKVFSWLNAFLRMLFREMDFKAIFSD